jgi:haloalkane dehalogenase
MQNSYIPEWLNTTEYPFTAHEIKIEGHAMRYIDEGEGDVLLFVHGTPVWSFLYRHCVKHFSTNYRCIALDHLGFGLSDKPIDADYSPKAHAERLAAFVQALNLDNITLITQDYGGAISLDFATQHPHFIKQFVIANSWIWLLPSLEQGGKLFSLALGKWLYLKYGFSAKFMIPNAFGNKKLLTPSIHAHYLKPLDTPEKRISTYALVQAFSRDHEWYRGIQDRISVLEEKPVLMLWGMKDRFVRYKEMMPLWKKVWKNMRLIEIDEAGHFVEEEAPLRVVAEIEHFLSLQKYASITS